MSWASRRQLTILSVFFVLIVGGLAILIAPALNKPPTCSDGRKNGDEHGVDCGGLCNRFCPAEVSQVTVRWYRSFPVTESVWSSIAYLENPNVNAGSYSVKYEFRLYDENHEFITVKEGEAYIPPNSVSVIYEPIIQVSKRVPKYTTFKFLSDPNWSATDPRISDIKLFAKDTALTGASDKPRFTGILTNTSKLYSVKNVDVIAILYNSEDNAVAVAKTFIEGFLPGESQNVYFTWPKPFPTAVTRTEIVTRFNPFLVSFE